MNRISLFLRRPLVLASITLAALLLVVYGDVLFSSREIVLSGKNTDLAIGFYGLKFVYGELSRGNFALWNPHLLSGYPIFASFQTMLLYPPAWIWAALPLAKATNLFIVFHLWLMGAGMIWWMLRRGLHPVAAFVAGVLLTFGSTGTMRVFPGHLTPLAVIAWMPILLAIFDGLLENHESKHLSRRSSLNWVLAGTAVVALQIAAGFPQHFFYTALAVGVYFLVRVFQRAWKIEGTSPWRFIFSRFGCACAIYGWGLLLLSVQLLTSWHASKETARASAMPFKFVASFSFPPENFLTLLAPGFFGGDGVMPYWGRGYVWEMCLFISVAGILLALYGMLRSTRDERWAWFAAASVMLVLALGKHTYLLKFLYLHVPIFGGFRASSRALCQASVFLCALAGLGLDSLIRGEKNRERLLKFWTPFVSLLAVLLMGISFWIMAPGAKRFWEQAFSNIVQSKESYLPDATYSDPQAISSIIESAGGLLLLAGVSCLFCVVLMVLAARAQAPRARVFAFALAVLCVFEVTHFASAVRPTFDLRNMENPALEKFFASQNNDDRFLKSSFDNWAMKWNANDLGGYESFRLRRYEEFINLTQGRNPDLIKPVLDIHSAHPLYAMLRCRYFLDVDTMQQTTVPNVLPHVLLVNDVKVLPSRSAIFEAMQNPSFDPRKTILLETEPSPHPIRNAPVGSARILESSTDHLVIEAQTEKPAMLLVTDSYSRDWQAWGLAGSSQQKYSVLPANWVLRAIPLQAGKHVIRLEYLPRVFNIGKWISLFSLLCYFAAFAFAIRARNNEPRA